MRAAACRLMCEYENRPGPFSPHRCIGENLSPIQRGGCFSQRARDIVMINKRTECEPSQFGQHRAHVHWEHSRFNEYVLNIHQLDNMIQHRISLRIFDQIFWREIFCRPMISYSSLIEDVKANVYKAESRPPVDFYLNAENPFLVVFSYLNENYKKTAWLIFVPGPPFCSLSENT